MNKSDICKLYPGLPVSRSIHTIDETGIEFLTAKCPHCKKWHIYPPSVEICQVVKCITTGNNFIIAYGNKP